MITLLVGIQSSQLLPERARDVTRENKHARIEYAGFADDLVILIDAYKPHEWLIGAVTERLREECQTADRNQ
ncbi:hypothetical protein H8A99_27955 [Bradyrhizobium sp. Arg68]|uniref:hypothetical protein n=1 Tax=Bradyrhizobium ivorense TaxID=2511166 RepID=UPI001E2E21D9|nr:hypothetical protein [Bradyrhizobium ivorense]MCC8940193.1 hypothetical protein [Bradyrhizobium ivorense]